MLFNLSKCGVFVKMEMDACVLELGEVEEFNVFLELWVMYHSRKCHSLWWLPKECARVTEG